MTGSYKDWARSYQRNAGPRPSRDSVVACLDGLGDGPIGKACMQMIAEVSPGIWRDRDIALSRGQAPDVLKLGPIAIGAILEPGIGRIDCELTIEINNSVPSVAMRTIGGDGEARVTGRAVAASMEGKLCPNSQSQQEAYYC